VLTFDYGFHLNMVLTALYFLPLDHWLPRWFGPVSDKSRIIATSESAAASASPSAVISG